MNKKLYLFVGAPCSGKGTQCSLIAKRNRDFIHISSGDLLRKNINQLSPIAKEQLRKGLSIDREFVSQLTFREIEKTTENNILLDNFIHSEFHAQYIINLDPKLYSIATVILIDVSFENLKMRFNNRFICAKCQVITNDAQVICCNQPVIKRYDDNLNSFLKRYERYQFIRNTIIPKFFASKINIVSGDNNQEKIYQEIYQIIKLF